MEKRVKEEARSITANCNIKIFGKLEDPTQTKEFFEKTVGSTLVMEASGFQLAGGSASTGSYYDTKQAGLQIRPRASYDALRGFKAGQAVIAFGEMVVDTQIFYCNPGFAKAMRVQRFVALPPPDEQLLRHAPVITKVRDLLVHKTWTALKAEVPAEIPDEIAAMAKAVEYARKNKLERAQAGMVAVAGVHILHNPADLEAPPVTASGTATGGGPAMPATPTAPPPQQASPIASVLAASRTPSPATPPAGTPPLTTVPPSAPPAAATPPAAAGGNPMSFFKKKDDAAPAQPQAGFTPPPSPEQQPARPSKPINWEELINNAPEAEAPKPAEAAPVATAPAPEPPPAQPQAMPQADVDAETRAILEKAAKDLQDKLLGQGGNEDA